MSIRKPSPIQRIGPSGNLPKQFPKLPPDFVRKFKELEEFNGDLADWWYDTMSVLQADSKEIRDLLNQAATEIATLKAKTATTT